MRIAVNISDIFMPFRAGDSAVSIAFHPPEIVSGTKVTIVSPQEGLLYAVQLPNGEYHRWFADFELRNADVRIHTLNAGDKAVVMNDRGHSSMIQKGMIVTVVKVLRTRFYDVLIENARYHRWLADFEIIRPIR